VELHDREVSSRDTQVEIRDMYWVDKAGSFDKDDLV
jgi:hypothetical protein